MKMLRATQSFRLTLIAGALVIAVPGCGSLLGVGHETLNPTDGGSPDAETPDGTAAADAMAGDAAVAPDAMTGEAGAPDAMAGDAAGGDAAEAGIVAITLTTSARQVNVIRGSSVTFGVTLSSAPVAAAAQVDVGSLPTGVTNASPAIPVGWTTGTVTLKADLKATLGPVPITLSIAGGPEAHVTLLVQDAPGTVDTTFGNAGVERIKFAYTLYDVGDLAVTADSQVIVAGNVIIDGTNGVLGIALAELDGNGAPASTFGQQGQVVARSASHLQDVPFRIALEPASGRILLAGFTVVEGEGYHSLAGFAFTDAGVVDSLFGTGGYFYRDFSSDSKAMAGALQSSGDFVLAGFGNSAGALVRVTSLGVLDGTFGDAGVVQVGAGLSSVAVQSDDAIVATLGTVPTALGRFSAKSGAIDPSYGDGGVATGVAVGGWAGIVVQPDDRIVVIGSAMGDGGTASSGIAIGRYLPNGSPDPSFGSDDAGATTTPLAAGAILSPSPKLAPDGRIVMAVSIPGALPSSFSAVRYTAVGKLDTSFGGTGIVTKDVGQGGQAEAIAVDSLGRVYLGGKATDLGDTNFTDAVVVRYWP